MGPRPTITGPFFLAGGKVSARDTGGEAGPWVFGQGLVISEKCAFFFGTSPCLGVWAGAALGGFGFHKVAA